MKDSAGQSDPLPYNLAKWDGISWQLTKVTVQTNYGLVTSPFYGIYAFSSNDIWILSGLPIHGDGMSWTQYDLYGMGLLGQKDGYMTKAWGTNSSDIYFVGTKGTIVHYNGSSWTKIESGTTLDFQDIYGAINPQTNQTEIVAVASQLDINQGNKIVLIQGTTVVPINSDGLSWSIVGVWFVLGQQYYIVGDGVGKKQSLQDTNPWNISPTGTLARYYSESIRGNAINDVIIAGAFGDMLHYNGSTWKDYVGQTSFPNGSFTSVAMKGNLVIAVGGDGPKAVITVGRR